MIYGVIQPKIKLAMAVHGTDSPILKPFNRLFTTQTGLLTSHMPYRKRFVASILRLMLTVSAEISF